MTLSERKILRQITVLPGTNAINVQWCNQILRGEEIVAETYHRKAYAQSMASEFAAEVENAAIYMQALGWTLDG